ncbi:MAG: UDP-N-acetylmuramoyl-L-alanine--D-glutamate ligase [Olsenella sp.]|jgi:UDP-N-acetylmuramoylalanine--D-glutamate ligase|nr:UDP-N-acetylmuramoyl-L-alanine--D-glutamate ligase [Olsenella sp.]
MSDENSNLTFLGRVLVLGLGKTGRAVADYLAAQSRSRVSSVTLYGGVTSSEGEASRALRAAGVDVVLGTEDVSGEYDLCVVSPGISEFCPFFAAASEHAREVVSEPEFAWRESPQRWVAITGSNGKTTTTTLATELICKVVPAVAVGNIGNLCIDEVAKRPEGEWFVAELSSFQLAVTSRLHPRIACLLNVTPDHLEWHGTMENYAAAKEKVFANLGVGDLAIVSEDDSWTLGAIGRLEARGLRVLHLNVASDPKTACAAFVRDGMLVVRLDGSEHELVAASDLHIKGLHNEENALAAAAIALEVGVGDGLVRDGLLEFQPLEHRIEPCGEVGGVRFVNDSKATNTDSVEKALTAFPAGSIVVMLGGHDKGTDLTSLAAAVSRDCKAAVCFGAAGERIARAVEAAGGGVRVIRAGRLADAFEKAVDVAEQGDVVLLSPACSSFDEFANMAERGRSFKAMVHALSRRESN